MDITSICFAFGILFILYHMILSAITKYKATAKLEDSDVIDPETRPTGFALDASMENFAAYQIVYADIVTCDLSRLEATTGL